MYFGEIFWERLWLEKSCFADDDGDAGVDIIIIIIIIMLHRYYFLQSNTFY
jgi:hypothetical protein